MRLHWCVLFWFFGCLSELIVCAFCDSWLVRILAPLASTCVLAWRLSLAR
jgi:hypothetical protein